MTLLDPPIQSASPATVLAVLLDLARTALDDCGAEPIDTSYVAAGAIAWDTCCGLLVAAPERIYRTDQFPDDVAADPNCDTATTAVDALVLLLRCVPVLDDNGSPPTAEALDTAYRALLTDAAVIWNTLAVDALPGDWERANVSQMFVGAEGGCVGVETRLTIGIDQHAWCPDCGEVAP